MTIDHHHGRRINSEVSLPSADGTTSDVIGSVVEVGSGVGVGVGGADEDLLREGRSGNHLASSTSAVNTIADDFNIDYLGRTSSSPRKEHGADQLKEQQQKQKVDRKDQSGHNLRRKRRRRRSKRDKQIRHARKAMIENVVRFSYHIPQTVLDDLISHEEFQVKEERQRRNEPSSDMRETEGRQHHDGTLRDPNDSDIDDDDSSSSSEGSLSSLSSGGGGGQKDTDNDYVADDIHEGVEKYGLDGESSTEGIGFIPSNLGVFSLPPCRHRDSCLLFVDVSGFTKLSTMLDAENISQIMSKYFEHICQEIRNGGGDVLKFAGDALFAEWKAEEVVENVTNDSDGTVNMTKKKRVKALRLATLKATRCAASIVAKYSDFEVSIPSSSFVSKQNESGSVVTILNVHCGIGCGRLTGLHVSDYHDGDRDGADHSHEMDDVEFRREYLFLGSAIDQVSIAAHGAADGQVFISPQGLKLLSKICPVPDGMLSVREPLCIAMRGTPFIPLPATEQGNTESMMDDADIKLRRYCKRLSINSLSRLHLQSALYVHPVVRGDLLATFKVSEGEIKALHAKTENAELRSVYTMFIKVEVSSELNDQCVSDLRRVMHVVSSELDRFSGQLRQFIKDDKGCVLIAVFGLRGSTFPDMVSNNALPATVSIRNALEASGIHCRIGATFGQVYCGTVGGIRRHEYSVMGAPVNLAARLMESKENSGVLVDESICQQASGKYAFKSLGSVSAKGYSRQIFIYEPLNALDTNSGRSQVSTKFFGRHAERREILSLAEDMLNNKGKENASVVAIVGETGVGKTALSLACLNEAKLLSKKQQMSCVSLRANNTADNRRIPFSTLKKAFITAIREMCVFDGSLELRVETISEKAISLASPTKEKVTYCIPGRKERSSLIVEGSREENKQTTLLFLEKLRLAVVKAGYPVTYADFIGSSFLGFDTNFSGSIPNANEVIVCASKTLLELVRFADLVQLLVDDFQWIDDMSFKVLNNIICYKKLLLICATRNHDKKAMRRISSGLNCHLQITLGPLQIEDIQALASSFLALPPDSQIDDMILEKTGGGLPTLVIDLLVKIKRDGSYAYSDDYKTLTFTDLSSFEAGTSETSTSILKESLLNRFDSLDSGVRKVLQTCAVLGNEFSDLDVYSVHPEMDPPSISLALSLGVSEMIIVQLIIHNEEDNLSISGTSQLGGASVDISRTSSTFPSGQTMFEFSHNMWRSTVLGTMLKERKRDLHKKIAIKMEENSKLFEGRSDLSMMLKLFDHWKSSGDFSKAASLALFIGKRLKDWDLLQQNLDLLRDAKDLCFQSLHRMDRHRLPADDEWILVSANSYVMDVIIQLYKAMAETYYLLSDPQQALEALQDAYTMLRSSSVTPNQLLIPVLTHLCLALNEIGPLPHQMMSLLNELVQGCRQDGSFVHISQALAMEAAFFAKQQDFEEALRALKELEVVYDVEEHSKQLVMTYGKDLVLDVFSQSVLWFFLSGQIEQAVEQAKYLVQKFLPYQHPCDVTGIMSLLLPCILVLKMVGRARDALYLLGKYVVNAHHDFSPCEDYWLELFNPLTYLLQIIAMEEDGGVVDALLVHAIKVWALNKSNSFFSEHHRRLGHSVMGELCFQLAHLDVLEEGDRTSLILSARKLLTPIALDAEPDPFLAYSATIFIQSMDAEGLIKDAQKHTEQMILALPKKSINHEPACVS